LANTFIKTGKEMYKFWITYYLFVKKAYTKRWKDMTSSAVALAVACMYIHLLLIFVIIDIFLKWNVMNSLFSKDLPLGPIATIVSIFLFTILFSLFKSSGSLRMRRQAVIRFRNFKRVYSIIYLVLTGIAFLGIIALLILSRKSGVL